MDLEAPSTDGRARSLDEAIRWHQGEGEVVTMAYDALGDEPRSALLSVVRSL